MMLGLLGVTSVQACAIGLVAGLLVYWLIQKRRYNLPPGPPALPLLGNVLRKFDVLSFPPFLYIHVSLCRGLPKDEFNFGDNA